MTRPATFTISLDFELHWGGFEKWPLENYKQYFLNTRQVIPEMLKLFRQYDVHVTWAGVGMLFHADRESMLKNAPKQRPSYAVMELSAYDYIESKGVGVSEFDDPFHFAGSLVEQIVRTPFQELGSHTFAHFYCNEPGQTIEQFKADLRAAQAAAVPFGRKLRSLVFPRNQFNEDYLRACYEEGFTAVRDNPRDWFWNIQSTQGESRWKRLNRGVDAYWPIGKKNTYTLESIVRREGLPVCIPASRLLRPYRPEELFLNSMKIERINTEMERAAMKNEVYHLWWHPHNFGNYPDESLEGLERILKNFKRCQSKFGMRSLSMGEIAEAVGNPLIVNR
jgi:peptidoglycan/xylan/chitin deacetylase (PgdA/CDA1 family)